MSNENFEETPSFVTCPKRDIHEKFFREAFDLILNDALFEGTDRKNPVLRFHLPEELKDKIDLTVKETPAKNHEEILGLIKSVINYSVKTVHPRFINQLYSGSDPYGVCGEWIAAALNASVYTYEVSPVFTLMEEEVFQKMRSIIGFPEGNGDGLILPGGSISNGYSISLARFKKHPEIKTNGLFGMKKQIIFVSEDAHYSFKKLAIFMGLGSGNVIGVKVDEAGKMIPSELEREIQESIERGEEPFYVAATEGTTVIGAFDPIAEIGEICRKWDLWFHVDAAWGGGALMSTKHRNLMDGIEMADSVTWNPHKLLCSPQQTSILLLKEEGEGKAAHATHASYLFQQDKFYDASKFDTGDKHIQCGRRADILKFWLMWKAKGTQGFENHIDKVFDTTAFTVQELKKREERFKLLLEPELTNVCFWFIPPSLRSLDRDSVEFKEKIQFVAPKIKERMMKAGTMMVTYQPLREFPNFFRIVYQSSEVNHEDVIFFLDEIENLGNDL